MRGLGRLYKRGDIWWIEYWIHGVQYRESSRSTRESDARKLLKQRIGEITSKTFVEPKEQRVTVDDLLDSLEADYRLREGRAYAQFRAHLKPIREAFGHLRANDITETTIDQYMKNRLEEGKKPATLNRETQLLGQAFRLAQERRLVQRVPHIRHLPERNARQGFFEQDEFEKVVEHLPAYLKDFARFAYLSGWRKGEISKLQWSDVDRQGGVIRLRPEISKTQEGRVLVLHGELWEIIERRWQERTWIPWTFHRKERPIGDIKKAWRTACNNSRFAHFFDSFQHLGKDLNIQCF